MSALLHVGADASLEDEEGLPALHGAAAEGRAEVVRAFLLHPAGKATNARHGRDGFHPIHHAARGTTAGHTAAVRAFIAEDPSAVLLRTHTGYTAGELAAAVSQTKGNEQAKETTRAIHESLHHFKAERASNPQGFVVRRSYPPSLPVLTWPQRGEPAPKKDFSKYFSAERSKAAMGGEL